MDETNLLITLKLQDKVTELMWMTYDSGYHEVRELSDGTMDNIGQVQFTYVE